MRLSTGRAIIELPENVERGDRISITTLFGSEQYPEAYLEGLMRFHDSSFALYARVPRRGFWRLFGDRLVEFTG